MGKRTIIPLIGAVVVAMGWGLWRYSERFEVKVVQDGVSYSTVEACYKNDWNDPAGIHVPVGTRLTVTSTDWSSKNWPCYESSYEGRDVFMTHRLIERVR